MILRTTTRLRTCARTTAEFTNTKKQHPRLSTMNAHRQQPHSSASHPQHPPTTKPSYLKPIALPYHLLSKATTFPPPIPTLATHLLTSLLTNTQIPRLSTTFPELSTLTQSQAYQTAASILQQRYNIHHETPVGRKLGFTNRNIWEQYNIDAPNWSYVYDSTVVDVGAVGGVFDLAALSNLQPRIEPELVLVMREDRVPNSGMSDVELLGCVGWVAPAFEVVVSPFPDWVFSAAETTAAFALHGRLLVGERVSVQALVDGTSPEDVLERLRTFEVELLCDGELRDTGTGANVLGSPVRALRFLVDKLKEDSINPGLDGGEVVTTGTLTKALEIDGQKNGGEGEVWEMRVKGLGKGVDGVECKFVCR